MELVSVSQDSLDLNVISDVQQGNGVISVRSNATADLAIVMKYMGHVVVLLEEQAVGVKKSVQKILLDWNVLKNAPIANMVPAVMQLPENVRNVLLDIQATFAALFALIILTEVGVNKNVNANKESVIQGLANVAAFLDGWELIAQCLVN